MRSYDKDSVRADDSRWWDRYNPLPWLFTLILSVVAFFVSVKNLFFKKTRPVSTSPFFPNGAYSSELACQMNSQVNSQVSQIRDEVRVQQDLITDIQAQVDRSIPASSMEDQAFKDWLTTDAPSGKKAEETHDAHTRRVYKEWDSLRRGQKRLEILSKELLDLSELDLGYSPLGDNALLTDLLSRQVLPNELGSNSWYQEGMIKFMGSQLSKDCEDASKPNLVSALITADNRHLKESASGMDVFDCKTNYGTVCRHDDVCSNKKILQESAEKNGYVPIYLNYANVHYVAALLCVSDDPSNKPHKVLCFNSTGTSCPQLTKALKENIPLIVDGDYQEEFVQCPEANRSFQRNGYDCGPWSLCFNKVAFSLIQMHGEDFPFKEDAAETIALAMWNDVSDLAGGDSNLYGEYMRRKNLQSLQHYDKVYTRELERCLNSIKASLPVQTLVDESLPSPKSNKAG